MIPGLHDLGLFVVSGLLLNVTPGADTLYIVGRSTLQGRKAGAVAALGIGAGCLVHTLAAAAGLSAILATSAAAFLNPHPQPSAPKVPKVPRPRGPKLPRPPRGPSLTK